MQPDIFLPQDRLNRENLRQTGVSGHSIHARKVILKEPVSGDKLFPAFSVISRLKFYSNMFKINKSQGRVLTKHKQ